MNKLWQALRHFEHGRQFHHGFHPDLPTARNVIHFGHRGIASVSEACTRIEAVLTMEHEAVPATEDPGTQHSLKYLWWK